MNKLKTTALLLTGATLLLASCLKDDEKYYADFGFAYPTSSENFIFANDVEDSVVFYTKGSWQIQSEAGNTGNWAAMSKMSGEPSALERVYVAFEQNNTGKGRYATFCWTDPLDDKSYARWYYYQFATRRDGALGTARDVRAIRGTDGSEMTFTYDQRHRPLTALLSKNGSVLSSTQLEYAKGDSIIRLTTADRQYTGRVSSEMMPLAFTSATDTIGFSYISAPIGYSSFNHIRFIVGSRSAGQSPAWEQTYKMDRGGICFYPDSLHNADSIYVSRNGGEAARYALEYQQVDNRATSVDLNQLLWGIEECDPLMLLSVFRYTRSTSVVQKALLGDKAIELVVSRNDDGSIGSLTVKDAMKGSSITYTLEY